MAGRLQRRTQLLPLVIALWIVWAVTSASSQNEVVALAAATPVEHIQRASIGRRLPGGAQGERRRVMRRAEAATISTSLPAGWMPVTEPSKSTRPTTTLRSSGLGTKTTPTQPASPRSTATSSISSGANSVEAEGRSSSEAQNAGRAVAAERREGGIKSPIQYRPLALQLSMPLALVGLGLNFVLFFLMIRGSAAVDNQARRVIQEAKMKGNGQGAK